MTLTRLTAAAALALACTTSSFAAVVGSIDLSSGSAGFSNTPAAGTFSDSFTITPTFASSFVLTGSVITVASGTQNIDFSSIFISGPSGTFNFVKSPAATEPFELWTTPTAGGFTLAAGNYTLTLNGTNSASIASYAGNLAITAVPEPQTVALMLAGLGVVGFVAGRRPR